MFKTKIIGQLMFVLLISSFLFISCKKDENGREEEEEQIKLQQYLSENGYSDLEPAESGLYHVIIEEGEGATPLYSDFVRIDFTGSLVDGTVFETNDEDIARANDLYNENRLYGPTKFSLEKLAIAGLLEGIMDMKQGGESRIIIPSNLGFGSADYDIVPPYSTLVYDVRLLDVIRDPEEYEQNLLEAFIIENEITESPTESGFYYIEIAEGTGSEPREISIVNVDVEGSLLDGRVFYSTSETGPLTVLMDSQDYIPAFLEGIMKMKTGGEARLIIPWDMAYGENGSSDGTIPPYSTIVFDLKVISIN